MISLALFLVLLDELLCTSSSHHHAQPSGGGVVAGDSSNYGFNSADERSWGMSQDQLVQLLVLLLKIYHFVFHEPVPDYSNGAARAAGTPYRGTPVS